MTPKECEAKFQEELKKYRLTGNSKSWEWVWICVQECCSNTIKSKAKGFSNSRTLTVKLLTQL